MKILLLSLFILCSFPFFAQAEKDSSNKLSSTQILAHQFNGGYTWTMASRLGYFLNKAQKSYGERDKSWTLLGVEFVAKGPPRIWYPFSHQKNTKYIAIQLTKNAASDKKRALFQLAHETIHILSPNGPGRKSNVFEEGLAAYFSIHALKGTGVNITADYIAAESYTKAYILVSSLYKIHPDTDKRIRELREKGLHFSQLSLKEFKQAFPKASSKLAKLLIQKFDDLR